MIIDTLRADHLGTYGYELDTSPVLDAFSERAYVFENNLAQCNVTMPSIISILTGAYVRTHRNHVSVPIEGLVRDDPELASLPERLQEGGYYTAGIVSHPSWTHTPQSPGFARGWDHFSVIPDAIAMSERNLLGNARVTNGRAFAALDEYERLRAQGMERPLFLWTHYFDPHTDLPNSLYNPPQPWRDRFLEHHLAEVDGLRHLKALATLSPAEKHRWIVEQAPAPERQRLGAAVRRALYDAEIAYCDSELERLFERLEDMGLYRKALIVVLADHGENMDESATSPHAFPFTHRGLREGVVHAPLMIRVSDQASGVRVGDLTQSIDVAPTILEMLGLPRLERAEGASLLPLMEGRTESLHEVVYTESFDNMERAIKDPTWKYVAGRDESYLFRWQEDQAEEVDRSADSPAGLLRRFERLLADFKPRECLHLRLTPAARRYDVEIDIRFEQTRLLQVAGAVAGARDAISEDGHRFQTRARVEGEPVDILLFPERRNSGSTWQIRSDQGGPVDAGIWLGQFPLERTTAIPLYRPLEAPAPAEPAFALAHGPDRLSVLFRADAPATFELELRQVRLDHDKTFEWLGGAGFTQLVMVDPPIYRARVDALPSASIVVGHARDESVRVLPRIDGHWPPAERVSIDGHAVDTQVVAFEIPWPLDKRVTTLLLAGPGAPEPASGALQVWFDSAAGGPLAIDPALLDDETLRQLQTLGYVDAPEDR